MTTGIFIGLGTNVGDKLANLRAALSAIREVIKIEKMSSVYKTEPWGYLDQDDFNNMVIEVDTELTPDELLTFLKNTENDLGRKETFRYGPRVIDMDILFYNDLILETERLSIPHPRMVERAFVLAPLNEIAPQAIHPILGLSIQQLAERVDLSVVDELVDVNL